jgi:uncharacterized membrane protein
LDLLQILVGFKNVFLKIWCDYGTFFSTKSLYELDWIFFGCQVVKIHPPKNDGLEMKK